MMDGDWDTYTPGPDDPPPDPDAPRIRATPFRWRDPTDIPRRPWLYGVHLLRGFVSLTVAPGAVGKTSLLVGDALSMATGRPLLGTHVHAGGPYRVWLWNLEDPADELERRIAAGCLYHGIGPEAIGDRLFLDSGRDQGLCIAEAGRDGLTIRRPVVDALVSELRARKIDLLVVDPFVSSHQVPENDNGAIDAVAKTWADVAHRAGCAIELVHHLRKLNGTEATADHARGAVALVAAARSCRVLNRMTPEEGEAAGVDNPRGYFRAIDDKANLAPPAGKSDWFRLESVPLGNGTWLGPVRLDGDTVGVVVPWQWPDPMADQPADALRRVQEAVDGKNYRRNVQAADWVGHAVGEVLGLDPENPADKTAIKGMLAIWIKEGALEVVEIADGNRRPRPCIAVGKWANEPGEGDDDE